MLCDDVCFKKYKKNCDFVWMPTFFFRGRVMKISCLGDNCWHTLIGIWESEVVGERFHVKMFLQSRN